MVALMLALMFSCSCAFGYVVEHPEVSYWYPVAYTAIVLVGMAVPAISEFFSLRKWDDEYSGGRRHAH